jgi:hypothetical protein
MFDAALISEISWIEFPAFSRLLYLQLVKVFMQSSYLMYLIQRGRYFGIVFTVTPVFMWMGITSKICQFLVVIWHVLS